MPALTLTLTTKPTRRSSASKIDQTGTTWKGRRRLATTKSALQLWGNRQSLIQIGRSVVRSRGITTRWTWLQDLPMQDRPIWLVNTGFKVCQAAKDLQPASLISRSKKPNKLECSLNMLEQAQPVISCKNRQSLTRCRQMTSASR